MYNNLSLTHARQLDTQDPLRAYREAFLIPQHHGRNAIYLCGNSLGLQCRNVKKEIEEVLLLWHHRGVEGHFESDNNWMGYNERLKPMLSKVVGAKDSELAIMNTLTVNLHLLMMSFYKPNADRYKIIIEQDAFPSDTYAVKSQLRYHGYRAKEALITVRTSSSTDILSIEDWKRVIDAHASDTALLIAGGINYYTGQLHDIAEITKYAQQAGIIVGWDLAHAIGNVPLYLHEWGVDFAVWCHYKYMNAGPGAIAGAFVHKRHHGRSLTRLEGWWGNHEKTRFLMRDEFDPAEGAEAWVCSTPPTLAIAPLKASLEIFDHAGMDRIIEKSRRLTAYLEQLILNINHDSIAILSPTDPQSRGAQLSIKIPGANKRIFEKISDVGVICDWREPDVIRMSPCPLYNSYEDAWQAADILRRVLAECSS